MLPWGHLAVGYLCYSLGLRSRRGVPPDGLPVIALAIGTQFPDLIDKPLAWTFGVIPSGRSFAHSLVVAFLLAIGVRYLARRYDRAAAGIAFLFGYLSHVFADAIPAALAGRWEELGYLLWPVTPAYRHPGEMEHGIIEFFLTLNLTPVDYLELAAFAVAVALWISDGTPGIRWLRSSSSASSE